MSKQKPNTILYIGIAVSIGILIGSFLDYNTGMGTLGVANRSEAKIKKLINYIQYEYVDEVNTDSLLDNTIEQMLTNLDPHSVYIPKSELQQIQENMNGSFKGIGIQFRMLRDSVTVLNVTKGGPSEKAGLEAGDRILIADADTLYNKKLSTKQIIDKLKGKENVEVQLKVYRKYKDSLIDFRFKRGDVNIVSVPTYYMINKEIGFIVIDRFARNTYTEFTAALTNLKQQGMKTMILDLRGNSGGYMDIANEIIDEFLSDGKLMVFTKSKSGKITNSIATSKGDFEKGKVYVLIDEESASASEILAGALQDNDQGLIVGRRSFGKGLVQQEMELGDGSAIRLTTARYYTPTGRSIQKPYDKKDKESYFHDITDRNANGEMYSKDSIPINDSLKYTTPKGKVVYGGGGIVPDIFVAVDSTLYLPTYHMNNIPNFIFDYVDTHREKFSKMSWQQFDANFDKDAILNAFFKKNTEGFHHKNTRTGFLGFYFKSMVARELFGEIGFYKTIQKKDKMIQKVLELENQLPIASSHKND